MKYARKYENVLTKEFLLKEYVEKKRTASSIAKEIGVHYETIYNYLNFHNIPQEDRTGKICSGMRFGKLETIEISGKDKGRSNLWLCKCDCGNISFVRTQSLKSKRTQSCGCVHKVIGKKNRFWKGHEDIPSSFWTVLKISARNRKINFDLTIEQIWELFEKQNRKCYLSELNIEFDEVFKNRSTTASLDRLDSSKGYEINNVGWVHKDINKIKTNFSIDDFVYYCNLISNFDGIYNKSSYDFTIHKSNLNSIKKGAEERSLVYKLTEEQLLQKFNDQGGVCAFTGINLIYPSSELKYTERKRTASLDRIDNSIGYTFQNVQWTHKLINMSRSNFSVERYKDLCGLVSKNYEKGRLLIS
jgi:hypothetical protein